MFCSIWYLCIFVVRSQQLIMSPRLAVVDIPRPLNFVYGLVQRLEISRSESLSARQVTPATRLTMTARPTGRVIGALVLSGFAWRLAIGETLTAFDVVASPGIPADIFPAFGCIPGCTVDITFTTSPSDIPTFVYVFRFDQWSSFSPLITVADPSPEFSACTLPAVGRIPLIAIGSRHQLALDDPGNGTTTHAHFTFPFTDVITIKAISCTDGSPVHIAGTVTLRNPGLSAAGLDHVSAESAGQPSWQVMLCCVYATITAAYLLGLLLYRKSTSPAQWLLTCPGILHTLQAAALATYFYTDKYELEYDAGWAATVLIGPLAAGALLACFLLVGMGWGHSVGPGVLEVDVRHRNAALLMVLLHATVSISGSASCLAATEADDVAACGALSIIAYTTRCVLMLWTMTCTTLTVAHIRTLLLDPAWTPATPIVYALESQYKSIRWCAVGYLLAPPLLLIIRTVGLPWLYEWLQDMLAEAIGLVIYGGLVWILQPVPAGQHAYEIALERLARSSGGDGDDVSAIRRLIAADSRAASQREDADSTAHVYSPVGRAHTRRVINRLSSGSNESPEGRRQVDEEEGEAVAGAEAAGLSSVHPRRRAAKSSAPPSSPPPSSMIQGSTSAKVSALTMRPPPGAVLR